jgi:hypothetical protein
MLSPSLAAKTAQWIIAWVKISGIRVWEGAAFGWISGIPIHVNLTLDCNKWRRWLQVGVKNEGIALFLTPLEPFFRGN